MLTLARFGSHSFYILLAALALGSCGSSPQPQEVPVFVPVAQPVMAQPQNPPPQGFDLWLADFKREALAKGIAQPVLDNAFAHTTGPLQNVLDRDQTQPEKVKTFNGYLKGVLKPRKIDAARDQWNSHRQILADVSDAYGVPAPILLSLWQSESNFGKIQGHFSIVDSLATLAYDGRRSAFFRTQLLDALMLLQQEHMDAATLTGSWAGAMGQVQFMPSSFLSFAVDFDGDGKKDIWNDDADAVASMANYLHTKGWDARQSWGFHVTLPEGADASSWAQAKEWHTMSEWRRRGLQTANRTPRTIHGGTQLARLVIPDDDPENAYLVTKNYDILMDWNRSIYFATSVGLLADAIGEGEP